jgi:hypothetical protein
LHLGFRQVSVEEIHDCGGNFFLGGFEWLRILGSHSKWLKKLTINLDALCRADCPRESRIPSRSDPTGSLLEILPLVRLAWNSDEKLEIAFVHPQAPAHGFSEAAHGVAPAPTTRINALSLTDVIRAMSEDQLHIRPHDFLVHSIGIRRDGSMGGVSFKTLNNERKRIFKHRSKYRVSDATPRVFSYTQDHGLVLLEPERPTLMKLPSKILSRIASYALD